MHITSPQIAAFITVFTIVLNATLGYFNIPNTLACSVQNAAPETQAAAAALVGR